MAATPSTMLALGTAAPDFALEDARTSDTVRLADLEGAPALLVAFICNHCPFVVHVRDQITAIAADYEGRGLAIVGINSNSLQTHPQDGPEHMAALARELGWSFPYLFDETQQVAQAYRAACTPDFFLFDAEQRLTYRGQLDDSRPDSGLPVSGADLRAAIDATLEGRPVSDEQKPSIGCNIKWTPGNEPDYFG